MAKSNNSKKRTSSKSSKKSKSSFGKKILVILLVAALLAFGGYVAVKYYPSSQERLVEIQEMENQLELLIPTSTKDSLALPTEIAGYDNILILWTSSDENSFSNSGKINLATGSKKIVLTAKYVVTSSDPLENFAYSFLIKKSSTFQIDVIGGEVSTNEVTAVSLNFDNLKSGTYSTPWELQGFMLTNVIVAENKVVESNPEILSETTYKAARCKAASGAPAIIQLIDGIENVKTIKFNYEIFSTDKKDNYTKDTVVKVYASTNSGSSWDILKTSSPLGSDNYQMNVDTSSIKGDAIYKIEVTTYYSSIRVDIDDLVINRSINSSDVIKWLKENVHTSYTENASLFTSTKYGGVISWSSSNKEVFSDSGVVKRLTDTTKLTLTATITGITGIDKPIVESIDITVLGTTAVTPVMVYFIDLGKYGTSDCGESILIVYDNFDVLIDAGDDPTTSKQAVKEGIEAHSNDKIIDYVVATHPDSDHIGGMKSVFENFQVLNLIQFSGEHTTKLYQEYVNAYNAEECSVCTAIDSYNNVGTCKREIIFAPDVKIIILNTLNYEGKETNTRSVVFILEAYGTRVLFTGDADNGSNSNLENDYKDTVGNIDILKAVHHGTREGTTTPFLEATDPEVVIITNGNYLGNKHGHPTYEAVNRIYQYDSNIEVYAVTGGDSEVCETTSSGSYKCEVNDPFVDRNGTITIKIDNSGYDISSEYYNDDPLEFSSTNFWKNNENRVYSYGK